MRAWGWSLNPIDYIANGAHAATGGRIGYDADLHEDYSLQGGDRSPVGPTVGGLGAQIKHKPMVMPGGSDKANVPGHREDSGPSNYPNLNLGAYGGGGGNRASASQLAEYQQGIDQAQHNLGRVDTQLGIRRANINDAWKKKSDALDSSIARAIPTVDGERYRIAQLNRLPLDGPVKMLRAGDAPWVDLFAVDETGRQRSLRCIGEGRLGDGAYPEYPLF
ncbi:MAG: hypothetical protein Q4A34_04000 [Candidatus Saccharibacteria bacterium]|nr:hypothetical protein [Candidatus Saccharibacteria bacterium]